MPDTVATTSRLTDRLLRLSQALRSPVYYTLRAGMDFCDDGLWYGYHNGVQSRYLSSARDDYNWYDLREFGLDSDHVIQGSLISSDVYSPKAFASSSPLPAPLAARSIPISMLPRPKDAILPPFDTRLIGEQLQTWRDSLAVWALLNAAKCAGLSAAPALGVPEALDDTARDFMAPLFAVAQAAGRDTAPLLAFCQTLAALRPASAFDHRCSSAISTLRAWLPPDQPHALLPLKQAAPLFQTTPRQSGALLRLLGFDLRVHRLESKTTDQATWVSASYLDHLARRFPVNEASLTDSRTPPVNT